MYKIVFVVAVFAFAIQGAVGRFAVDPEVSAPNAADALPAAKSGPAVENKPDDPPSTASTPTTPPTLETTTQKSSGASGSEICALLVQVSSLALVAKHALL